jgi:hypothetical protein
VGPGEVAASIRQKDCERASGTEAVPIPIPIPSPSRKSFLSVHISK